MIRPAAAQKLAENLFGTYVRAGVCSQKSVDDAAAIIQSTVEIDEHEQEIERLAGELAARNLQAAVAEGYSDPRVLPSGDVIGVRQMVATFGLFVGITTDGYRYRYCYERAEDALAALKSWDGTGDAPGPWIKRKGIGVDKLGPGAIKEPA